MSYVQANNKIFNIIFKITTFLGNVKLVQSLINLGADINLLSTEGCAPIHSFCSIRNADQTILERLLEAGADINVANDSNETPIILACKVQNFETIKKLLQHENLNVEAMDQNGNNILIWVSKYGNVQIATSILAKVPELVNSRNFSDTTSLHKAVLYNQLDMVKLLLSKGANVNAVDAEKQSGIHMMAGIESDRIQKLYTLLIDNGANIDATDIKENTILMNAIKRGNMRLVNILIDGGANVNVLNSDKKTALCILSEKLLNGEFFICEQIQLLIERLVDQSNIFLVDENGHNIFSQILTRHRQTESEIFSQIIVKKIGQIQNIGGQPIDLEIVETILEHDDLLTYYNLILKSPDSD